FSVTETCTRCRSVARNSTAFDTPTVPASTGGRTSTGTSGRPTGCNELRLDPGIDCDALALLHEGPVHDHGLVDEHVVTVLANVGSTAPSDDLWSAQWRAATWRRAHWYFEGHSRRLECVPSEVASEVSDGGRIARIVRRRAGRPAAGADSLGARQACADREALRERTAGGRGTSAGRCRGPELLRRGSAGSVHGVSLHESAILRASVGRAATAVYEQSHRGGRTK